MSELKTDATVALYTAGVHAVVAVSDRFDMPAWSKPACGEWDASETARHLVAVVEWYDEWLDRAMAGDASMPFTEDEFDQRNSVGIERHRKLSGPAAIELFESRAHDYLRRATAEWNRPFGYPGGTVTVGLHCAIAATEWHLHAWDFSSVRGPRHEPQDSAQLMVAAANAIAHTKSGVQGRMIRFMAPIAAKRRPWNRLISESGRTAHR